MADQNLLEALVRNENQILLTAARGKAEEIMKQVPRSPIPNEKKIKEAAKSTVKEKGIESKLSGNKTPSPLVPLNKAKKEIAKLDGKKSPIVPPPELKKAKKEIAKLDGKKSPIKPPSELNKAKKEIAKLDGKKSPIVPPPELNKAKKEIAKLDGKKSPTVPPSELNKAKKEIAKLDGKKSPIIPPSELNKAKKEIAKLDGKKSPIVPPSEMNKAKKEIAKLDGKKSPIVPPSELNKAKKEIAKLDGKKSPIVPPPELNKAKKEIAKLDGKKSPIVPPSELNKAKKEIAKLDGKKSPIVPPSELNKAKKEIAKLDGKKSPIVPPSELNKAKKEIAKLEGKKSPIVPPPELNKAKKEIAKLDGKKSPIVPPSELNKAKKEIAKLDGKKSPTALSELNKAKKEIAKLDGKKSPIVPPSELNKAKKEIAKLDGKKSPVVPPPELNKAKKEIAKLDGKKSPIVPPPELNKAKKEIAKLDGKKSPIVPPPSELNKAINDKAKLDGKKSPTVPLSGANKAKNEKTKLDGKKSPTALSESNKAKKEIAKLDGKKSPIVPPSELNKAENEIAKVDGKKTTIVSLSEANEAKNEKATIDEKKPQVDFKKTEPSQKSLSGGDKAVQKKIETTPAPIIKPNDCKNVLKPTVPAPTPISDKIKTQPVQKTTKNKPEEKKASKGQKGLSTAEIWELRIVREGQRPFIKTLAAAGGLQIWLEEATTMDILVKQSKTEQLAALLTEREIDYSRAMTNFDDKLKVKEAIERPCMACNALDWCEFKRLKNIENFLENLTREFPHLCSLHTIGKSFEDRKIYMLKISDENCANEGVWINAGLNGCDWIGTAAVTFLANILANNYADLPKCVTTKDWYLVPVANPDGYEYSHTNDRVWRKNRSPNKRFYGVDLNRNFSYGWQENGEAGSSENPSSVFYRGTTPFSENECLAIKSCLVNANTEFLVFLSLHSYGEAILFPYGCTSKPCADYVALVEGASHIARGIHETNGRIYKVGSIKDLMYYFCGNIVDWSYGELKIPYSYMVQIGSKKEKYFVEGETIVDSCMDLTNGIVRLLDFLQKRKMKTCACIKMETDENMEYPNRKGIWSV